MVAVSVAPPAASAQDPPPEPDSVIRLQPLAVTARNREELLQDVPLSVTALSGRALELGQVGTTDQLGQMMPNVHFNNFQRALGHEIRVVGCGEANLVTGAIDGRLRIFAPGLTRTTVPGPIPTQPPWFL